MSRENVETVRRLYQLQPVMDRATLPSLVEHLAGDVDWLPGIARDLQGAGYRGHAGVRRWVEDMLEAWEEQWFDPIEFIDAGDHVLVDLRYRARGRASGIEVASNPTHVWTFRRDKVVRFQSFDNRSRALADLGLSPEAGSP